MQRYVLWMLIVVINIKIEDVYEHIADDVEKRFDTSSYEINRPLPMGKKESNWIN